MNQAWRDANSNWAVELAEKRDARIAGAIPVEPGKLTSLLVWTQKNLCAVAKDRVDVQSLVQMVRRPGSECALVCGKRDGPSFIRKDGVRCHFTIVLRAVDGNLEIVSYAFHLDAPVRHEVPPRFLRWEFSATPKSGVDSLKEPQAHLHPGHDDIRLPSPVLTPKELIGVFLSLEVWT